MSDWRLYGQEDYLQGKALKYTKFVTRGRNDHEHCAFCTAKIAEEGVGEYTCGYATEDLYWWVCEECFEDFKERFEWTLR